MNNVPKKYGELKGSDKAAALLMTLPPEDSAGIFRTLSEAQMEKLTVKLLHPDQLQPEVHEELLNEAHTIISAEEYIATGGVEYARGLLSQAIGFERANEIIQRLLATLESQPFHYLATVDPSQIANFLHNEHPQTTALILSYLPVKQAADVIALLPELLQAQVSLRLANMDTINPAIIEQVETAFKKRLSSVLDSDRSKTGGVEFLVRVLTQVDRTTERSIIEQLDETAPELAADIKRQMFVFENIVQLDDRSLQRVLRDVDNRDLALALRGATPTVRSKIYANMSTRAAQMIQEELENSPPVRLRTIEQAQQKIVDIVRALEDEEEITVVRGAGDVLL